MTIWECCGSIIQNVLQCAHLGHCKEEDLQGVFVKIGDFIKFKGCLVKFLQNRRSSENQKPPEKKEKSIFLSLTVYNAPSLHTVKMCKCGWVWSLLNRCCSSPHFFWAGMWERVLNICLVLVGPSWSWQVSVRAF